MAQSLFSGVIWVTGFPGAGKTTFSQAIVDALKAHSISPILLDGDELRRVFDNQDFTPDARKKLALSYAKMSQYLASQQQVVICATVSMFHEVRQWSRENNAHYYEIWLDVSEQALQQRDQKGLYSAAKAGKENKLPGVTLQAETPVNADNVLCDMPVDAIPTEAKKVADWVIKHWEVATP